MKKDCNPLHSNADCDKIYICIKGGRNSLSDLTDIILDEIEENYLLPTIFSTFLLIFQLVENAKPIK
jgi:hypothetical protein